MAQILRRCRTRTPRYKTFSTAMTLSTNTRRTLTSNSHKTRSVMLHKSLTNLLPNSSQNSFLGASKTAKLKCCITSSKKKSNISRCFRRSNDWPSNSSNTSWRTKTPRRMMPTKATWPCNSERRRTVGLDLLASISRERPR